jgi:hypothetical protein
MLIRAKVLRKHCRIQLISNVYGRWCQIGLRRRADFLPSLARGRETASSVDDETSISGPVEELLGATEWRKQMLDVL